MLISLLAFALIQALPPGSSAGAVLNNGACLDSPVSVPHTIQGSGHGAQVVQIQKVISTATYIDGQIIGYLYTRHDGSEWLGQRSQDYMSGADSRAINAVLAAARNSGDTVSAFPPLTRYGVKTNYQQEFRVHIPPESWATMRIRLAPCVAWPGSEPLPDPIP